MSQPAPQRTTVLLQRVDTATDALVNNFKQIVDLSANSGKERGYVASEVFQIEANATSLVRSAEELLFVTRSLKEAWILGQIKPLKKDEDGSANEQTTENTTTSGNVTSKAEELLDAILKES